MTRPTKPPRVRIRRVSRQLDPPPPWWPELDSVIREHRLTLDIYRRARKRAAVALYRAHKEKGASLRWLGEMTGLGVNGVEVLRLVNMGEKILREQNTQPST
jgi:hypothetical protein